MRVSIGPDGASRYGRYVERYAPRNDQCLICALFASLPGALGTPETPVSQRVESGKASVCVRLTSAAALSRAAGGFTERLP